MTAVKTKDNAVHKAIEWKDWQAGQSLSYSELAKWQTYFVSLAERFGLKTEFKENGII